MKPLAHTDRCLWEWFSYNLYKQYKRSFLKPLVKPRVTTMIFLSFSFSSFNIKWLFTVPIFPINMHFLTPIVRLHMEKKWLLINGYWYLLYRLLKMATVSLHLLGFHKPWSNNHVELCNIITPLRSPFSAIERTPRLVKVTVEFFS